jgi:hypothetical protein
MINDINNYIYNDINNADIKQLKLELITKDTNDEQIDNTLNEQINNIIPIIEKKKRGRKPKNYLSNIIIQANQNENIINEFNKSTNISSNISLDKSVNVSLDKSVNVSLDKSVNVSLDKSVNVSFENLPIKKRGRKANTKIINLVQDINIDIVTNLIAHLPLKMLDIVKVITTHPNQNSVNSVNSEEKPQLISKYVDFTEDVFDKITKIKSKQQCFLCTKCILHDEKIKFLEEEILNLKNGIMDNTINFNKKIYESKVNFFDSTSKKWIEKTDILCWWCCHKFDHVPIGIPEFINKDKFYLFGCFCSFNCMMAYNMDLNDYKIWDRQSNIYQMKNKIDPENKITIHPAPPRQSLEIFGGPLSIQKFRESFFILNKEFRYFFPPMISIIGIIEEENRNIINNSKSRQSKIFNQPIIQRKKQLPKQLNSLNNILNK